MFGERAALLEYNAGGTNTQYIMYLKRQLCKAIDEVLTEQQKRAVTGYYLEGKSITEIAREQGVNRSTVSRNLKRGITRLSAALRFCEPYAPEY